MATSVRIAELEVRQCLELLASHHLGRIAVNDNGGPLVFPVNYVLDDATVVFRTDDGGKVDAALREASACFEVDDVDEDSRRAWSVVVRGLIQEVTDTIVLSRLRRLPPHPFAGSEGQRYARIAAAQITGRRVEIPESVPVEWLQPRALGHVWLGQDGDDLGLS